LEFLSCNLGELEISNELGFKRNLIKVSLIGTILSPIVFGEVEHI
jgi:hypothetical protein